VNRSRIFALVLAVAAAAQGHGREPVRVQVPFETAERNVTIVRVTVAGKPPNFILDTGAELTLLDREFAGFAKPEANKSETPGGHGIATVGFAQVASLCFEKYCLRDWKVGIGEFADVSRLIGRCTDGAIGQDLMREFDEVSIDYKHGTVTLTVEERLLGNCRHGKGDEQGHDHVRNTIGQVDDSSAGTSSTLTALQAVWWHEKLQIEREDQGQRQRQEGRCVAHL
jgi:hypothetical protein